MLDRRRTSNLPTLLAFLILAVSAFVALDASNRQNDKHFHQIQLESCERTNDTRREVNVQANVARKNNEVSAAIFRNISKIVRTTAGDNVDQTAAAILQGSKQYDRFADKYKPLPLIDCEKVIREP